MEKIKLIEARKNKGYSQEYMAIQLGLDESTYCRRERGQIKITPEEWKKLCVILGVSIEEIYEGDENQMFFYNENSPGNCQGNNNSTINYNVPQFVLESMQKLINKLEEENKHLKDLLKQGKK
jgi:DNA-binding XRE family transcriptional regulator